MSKKKRPDRGTDATGRSKRDGRHMRHYEFMLASPAYRSLSLAGRCLLTEMYRLFNGENNGTLYLSVRTAATLLDVNPKTALKAFHEIEQRGFVRPAQRGAFSLKVRHATSWVLTEFEHAGQVATKDFMRWRADADATAEIQKSVPLRGTVGTPTRNAVPLRGTEEPPHGTPTRNRDAHFGPSVGTPTRNTDSLPGGVAGERTDGGKGDGWPDSDTSPKNISSTPSLRGERPPEAKPRPAAKRASSSGGLTLKNGERVKLRGYTVTRVDREAEWRDYKQRSDERASRRRRRTSTTTRTP